MPSGMPPCSVSPGARSASGWSSPGGSGSAHSSACVSLLPCTSPDVSCFICSSRRGLCLSLPRSIPSSPALSSTGRGGTLARIRTVPYPSRPAGISRQPPDTEGDRQQQLGSVVGRLRVVLPGRRALVVVLGRRPLVGRLVVRQLVT